MLISYAGEEPIEDDVECGLCGYGFDTVGTPETPNMDIENIEDEE